MKHLLIALFIISAALPALAGDEAGGFPQSGFEFGLPSTFGLDNFRPQELDGFDISWTRRTSETRGWRFGSTLYFNDDDSHDITQTGFEDYTRSEDQVSASSAVNIAFQAEKLFMSEPRHGMAAILGFGPAIGYTNSKSTSFARYRYTPITPGFSGLPEDYTRDWESDQHSYWVGMVWDLGFEWRISPQVSLGARYQWGLTYKMTERDRLSNTTGDYANQETNHEEDNSLRLNGSSVDLVATFWY